MVVKNIMQCDVITVFPKTSLKEVGRLIFGNRINALPVVDQEKRLIGIIADKDVLEKFYPTYEEYIDDYVHARDFDSMEKKAKEVMKLTAKDVMKKDILTISDDTPILKASGLMLVRRVSQLPVIGNGRLVGIVSRGDIFRSLVGREVPVWRKEEEIYDRIAPRYDVLMEWKKRLEDELPFMIKLFTKYGVRSILDVGCGTGEHAIALAQKGFKVTGIDISEKMIEIAIKKKDELPSGIKDNLEFVRSALGGLPERLGKKFDAAICLGNMLPHVDNLEYSLQDINHNVKNGAILIVQIRNYDKVISEKQRILDIDFREMNKIAVKEVAFIRFFDFREDGKLSFNILSLSRGNKGWKAWDVESTTHLPLKKDLLITALTKVGFKVLKTYGSLEGEEFDPVKSPGLVTVARKK